MLTDDQREIQALVRTLAQERIAPRAAEIDESHEFPWDVVDLFRENELFALYVPERYGGTGTGALAALLAIEEVSKVCATSGLILAVQSLGALGLELAGTDEQKDRYLPRLGSGEILGAYALTEAGSGSVFANTVYSPATPAFVMKRFWPLSTYVSPRRSARARIAAASDPDPASVSA